MQLLRVIKELVPNLPERDSRLASKFIEKRDFESVYELVKSDIYLIEQDALKDTPSNKYDSIDLDKLVELREALEEYINLISPLEDTNELEDYD